MRLNRNTRLGLTLIGAALLLLLLVRLFRGSGTDPQQVATNPNPNPNPAPAQPVALNSSGMSAVAAMNLPPRTIVTADMLEMRPIPGGDSQLKRDQYQSNPSLLVGSITGDRPLYKGHRLLKTDTIGHITDVGIAGALRPGTRAMFVPIAGATKSTLHDMVAIGDFVDVIGSFDGQESRNIASNVRVLAVDTFVGDFPQVKGARRGDYRAASRNAAAPAPAPAAPGAPQGQPGAPGAPTPTPTATPEGPPPAKPDPALTLEVTPDQATAIALSQNANATLDFVLRPRPAILTTPETRVVALTRPRLSPYSDRIKRNVSPQAKRQQDMNDARTVIKEYAKAIRGDDGNNNRGGTPTYNPEAPGPMIPPQDPGAPMGGGTVAAAAPETYNIPIYGDGKMTRIDTVRKPE